MKWKNEKTIIPTNTPKIKYLESMSNSLAASKNGTYTISTNGIPPMVKKSIIVGLPGNTAAMFTIFIRIIKPLILMMSGATKYLPNYYYVESGFSHKKKQNRTEFLRVKLLKKKTPIT